MLWTDMLPEFAEGVTYTIGFDEGYTITFRSTNQDHLEEAYDKLHRLAIGRGIEELGMIH